jgi:two-component system CheB/CheR fusion protein
VSEAEQLGPAADADDLGPLLEYLTRTRGFDFGAYKRTTLGRRIRKRMEAVGARTYADYLDYLEVTPNEFALLFDTILINVTRFYRDPENWRALAERGLPRLLAAKGDDAPIRVWSAGSSSGEEAYTAAMLLAETLGEEAFRERVKIYATDVDEAALERARLATYTADDVADLPPGLRERYFDRGDRRYTFRPDLRRSVIFGRNDLVQDAPISRVDLLICRNTLMYFNAEAQERILGHLHFALSDVGLLFLGKSEMLINRSDLFTPVDARARLLAKVPRPPLRERLALLATEDRPAHAQGYERLRDGAFDLAPVAQVVVDRAGLLQLANLPARSLFALDDRDVGRPVQDLELSYRPVELRSAIERAAAERRPVLLGIVPFTPRGDAQARELEVRVVPLMADRGQYLGASATFADVTREHQMRTDLEQSQRELETAYEELQSTVEELETTNEELQSTNEELETTNEELQSTNEELETMNEELQSTNEELSTINDELRERSSELDQVNASLEAILTSLGVGVAVLDRDQIVRIWNGWAEELWGLRPSEAVGRHFLSLDVGLPVERLRQPIREALAGETGDGTKVQLDAVTRRGRPVRATVTCLPLPGPASELHGVIVLTEVAEQQAGDGAAARR